MAETKKQANLTVTPDEIRNGRLCGCEACRREGQHLPECGVHDEPKRACTCARDDQVKGAG